jgi:Tfp pilus assembly protein PilO
VKITAREKLFLIVGTVVVAAVLIFYLISLQLPNSEGLAQEVDFKKRLLLKQREILSYEKAYREQVEQYSKRLEQSRLRLLPGDNPNVAGAELQRILMDLASRSGVEITQKNPLPEKNIQDILTKIAVRIETNGDPEQLVHFVTAIENYEKFLKIEQFMISGFKIQIKHQIKPVLTVVGYIGAQEPEPAENGGE